MTTLLALAVLALASVTAYFAVYGLAALAPAVPYSMIALGLSLEFGKYVSLTYVYAHWSSLPFKLKAVTSTILVAVLMLTSIGVFGYLQSAFSASLAASEVQASTLDATNKRIAALETELREIDAETKRVPDTAVRSRIALLREYDNRRRPLTAELTELRATEAKLRTSVLETRAHTGPLSYVASALNVPLDTAVFWMAVLLTVSLDPMAIALSLLLVYARQRSKTVNDSTPPVAPVADDERTVDDLSDLPVDSPTSRDYVVSYVYEDGTTSLDPRAPDPEPAAAVGDASPRDHSILVAVPEVEVPVPSAEALAETQDFVDEPPPSPVEQQQEPEPPVERRSALGTRIP